MSRRRPSIAAAGSLLLCAALASAQAPDAADTAGDQQPYGLQRFEAASASADHEAAPALSRTFAALLGALASAALLLAARRLRAAQRAGRARDGASADEAMRTASEAGAAHPPDAADAARRSLALALDQLLRDPRGAANHAAGALRAYGAQRWIIDLRALTTPEIERALAPANTPETSREFVRLLSRYDAERFQAERGGALGPDALRACIEASRRFVDATAARRIPG